MPQPPSTPSSPAPDPARVLAAWELLKRTLDIGDGPDESVAEAVPSARDGASLVPPVALAGLPFGASTHSDGEAPQVVSARRSPCAGPNFGLGDMDGILADDTKLVRYLHLRAHPPLQALREELAEEELSTYRPFTAEHELYWTGDREEPAALLAALKHPSKRRFDCYGPPAHPDGDPIFPPGRTTTLADPLPDRRKALQARAAKAPEASAAPAPLLLTDAEYAARVIGVDAVGARSSEQQQLDPRILDADVAAAMAMPSYVDVYEDLRAEADLADSDAEAWEAQFGAKYPMALRWPEVEESFPFPVLPDDADAAFFNAVCDPTAPMNIPSSETHSYWARFQADLLGDAADRGAAVGTQDLASHAEVDQPHVAFRTHDADFALLLEAFAMTRPVCDGEFLDFVSEVAPLGARLVKAAARKGVLEPDQGLAASRGRLERLERTVADLFEAAERREGSPATRFLLLQLLQEREAALAEGPKEQHEHDQGEAMGLVEAIGAAATGQSSLEKFRGARQVLLEALASLQEDEHEPLSLPEVAPELRKRFLAADQARVTQHVEQEAWTWEAERSDVLRACALPEAAERSEAETCAAMQSSAWDAWRSEVGTEPAAASSYLELHARWQTLAEALHGCLHEMVPATPTDGVFLDLAERRLGDMRGAKRQWGPLPWPPHVRLPAALRPLPSDVLLTPVGIASVPHRGVDTGEASPCPVRMPFASAGPRCYVAPARWAILEVDVRMSNASAVRAYVPLGVYGTFFTAPCAEAA